MQRRRRLTHRSSTCSDDDLTAFIVVRPRLLGIVCRMLGSAADAEDVVQDAWVRWQMTDRARVRDPAAFLVTTVKRLAINVRQSARSRREAPVGGSLPERADARANPQVDAERGQAVKRGILSLLETLTPNERAAYILREAFDYSFRDIADVLGLGEANARQVATRARQHVASRRAVRASSADHRRLLEAFLAAADSGDVSRLDRALRTGRCHVATLHRVQEPLPNSTDRCDAPCLAIAV